jgi:NTP pyrophosphatase (non-canonical NTP hydrolase)
VIWDEDIDRRILTMLDEMPMDEKQTLLVVREHEGSVDMVWGNSQWSDYGEIEVERDLWCVEHTILDAESTDYLRQFIAQSAAFHQDVIQMRVLKNRERPAEHVELNFTVDTSGVTFKDPPGFVTKPADRCAEHAHTMLNYVDNAMRSLSPPETYKPPPMDLFHSVCGVMTESGELMDALKRYCFYDKDMDPVNLKEEYGDLLWYIALGCKYLGCNMAELMDMNIRKLAKRYPDKFSKQDAVCRDLTSERAELERERLNGMTGDELAVDMLTRCKPPEYKTPDCAPWLKSMAAQADNDQWIYNTARELSLKVEAAITYTAEDNEEHHRLMQLMQALDGFTEQEEGAHE